MLNIFIYTYCLRPKDAEVYLGKRGCVHNFVCNQLVVFINTWCSDVHRSCLLVGGKIAFHYKHCHLVYIPGKRLVWHTCVHPVRWVYLSLAPPFPVPPLLFQIALALHICCLPACLPPSPGELNGGFVNFGKKNAMIF